MNDKDYKQKQEMLEKNENEIAYFLQEWGIKNNQRLIGYDLHAAMDRPAKGKLHGKAVPTARAYFTDTAFKSLRLLYFTVNEKGGNVSVTQDKIGFKYPIKIMKTSGFGTRRIMPVNPIYNLLIDKKIILPFQSTMKKKDWQALPFIENSNMKAVNLFEE